jgi:SAM-dependent methyltransferase
MNKNDKGQSVEVWTESWEKYSIESLIQKWDFWGLRQWILKYTPRYGKSLEAGCGLGRNNFYLECLGINIDGLDFSGETIAQLNSWKQKNGFHSNFIHGNIKTLPFPDSSLSGYLSFGVIEHFIEGPHEALAEAYRVLRPGGIAVISTPGISFNTYYHDLKKKIKTGIKKLLLIKSPQPKFFQYYYNPDKLKRFIENTGLYVSRYSSADLLYAFCEANGYQDNWVKKGSFGNWFSQHNETSILKFLGAQSITISVKLASVMHCFFCGELSANQESLDTYDVPVCECCAERKKNLVSLYFKKRKVRFAQPYVFNPPILLPRIEKCSFCGDDYITHFLFEDFGFNKPVCKSCLEKPEVNILLSSLNIKPVWRR